MENNVQKFDSNSVLDGIRDKIKGTFVDMIPDAQWEALVKKEVDSFYDENNANGLRAVIREELTNYNRERINGMLATNPIFQKYWDDTGAEKLSEELMNGLVKNAPALMASLFQTVIGQIIDSSRYNNSY